MRILTIIAAAATLAGCASTRPASVAGECTVFRDPGRAVKGATRADQRDIDGGWLERGYASCGWPRPTK